MKPYWKRALLPGAAVAIPLFVFACLEPVPWPSANSGPCAKNNGGCDPNAICSVAPDAGTATCVCKAGFEGDGGSCGCATAGDVIVDAGESGGLCVSDACTTNNGGCDVNATCTNTASGASCTCNSGYEGDGTACTLTPVDAGTDAGPDAGPDDGGDDAGIDAGDDAGSDSGM